MSHTTTSLCTTLCQPCVDMLQAKSRRISWVLRGTYWRQVYAHHDYAASLEVAAADGCAICKLVWHKLTPSLQGWMKQEAVELSGGSSGYIGNLLRRWQSLKRDEVSVYGWTNEARIDGMQLLFLFGLPNATTIVRLLILPSQLRCAKSTSGVLDVLWKPEHHHNHFEEESPEFVAFDQIVNNDTLELSTASDSSWNMAMKWIEDCNARAIEHCMCHEHKTFKQAKPPRRLLKILAGESGTQVSLISMTTNPQPESYVTLSYTWGGVDQSALPLLRKRTLVSYESSIEVDRLPLLFRDVIDVAKRLGYQYLWIDALCIVQDDEKEKAGEVMRMDQIYDGADLNIVAAGAKDCHSSLFTQRDAALIRPIAVNFRWKQATKTVRDSPEWYGYQDEFLSANNQCYCVVCLQRRRNANSTIELPSADRVEPAESTTRAQESEYFIFDADYVAEEWQNVRVNTRAWVLQEELLSRRILHFGKHQLFWRCGSQQRCEMFPFGMLDMPAFRESTRLSSSDERSWYHHMQEYSTRSMTHEHDKLPAISGLARVFNHTINSRYLAGIWESSLKSNLLWHVADGYQGDGTLCKRRVYSDRNLYIAPSWSWASVSGKIDFPPNSYRESPTEHLVQILESGVDALVADDVFGGVSGGCLKVRGKVHCADHRFWMLCYQVHGQGSRNRNLVWIIGQWSPNMFECIFDDVTDYLSRRHASWIVPGISRTRDICLLPFLVRYRSSDLDRGCEGLIIVPETGFANTYRRVGYFRTSNLVEVSASDFPEPETEFTLL